MRIIRMLVPLLTTLLLLSSALAQAPAVELVKQGNEYASKGDYAQAIEAYTKSIRLDPGLATTFYLRGKAYYRNRDDDRAIQDYKEAIRLQPDYGEAFLERGHVYEDKSDYTHAIQDYTQAIRIRADDSYLRYDRAFAYERTGQYQPAIADLTEVVRRFPKAADAYRNRGRLWLYAGNPAQAQQDLSRAVEFYPSDPYNVIWLYLAEAKAVGPGQNGLTASELAKNAAKLNLTKWPGPVIQMFLGNNTANAVLQAASDSDPIKKKAQECEANFYVAENEALHGRRSAALQGFHECAKICPKNYFFYEAAARAELSNNTVTGKP